MPTWRQLKNKPELWQTFLTRQKIVSRIRNFFQKKNFLELSTPQLLPAVIPESYLDIFSTARFSRQRKQKTMFLAASPEASLKKLLVAGSPNCFEITKSFRNTEVGSKIHHFEFTILEWYRRNASYMDIIKDCEELILYLNKKNFLVYRKNKIDLTPPWPKISVPQALKKYAQISFDDITDKLSADNYFPLNKIATLAKKKGYSVSPKNTWEEIFNQIFLNEIEPVLKRINRPIIIYDFPAPLAALAKLKNYDRRLSERFELYIGGLEMGDCYSELTDYLEQKKRFQENLRLLNKTKKNPVIADADFLDALRKGLPQCAGMAVGVDRLIMLLTDKNNIQDTILTLDY